MSDAPPDPANLRRSYRRGHLDDRGVAATWHEQLADWFAQAAADPAITEPNAMQLATADASGRPQVRTVLAKAMDERGVVFYTNYDSDKGRHLAVNPQASAVFAWLPQERQVRITGSVAQVARDETERYFATRPRASQLGAWASPQSQVVPSRQALDEAEAEVARRFGDGPIPPPPNWGGYLLRPESVEFWQGRTGRLHDRIRYRIAHDEWIVERLAP